MTLLTLDATQRRAATSVERLQLVLAGPGSGKTTTLAARFVHLVQDGVDRTRILALTFTKKAADEMKARIAAALDLSSAADLNVATFHGFAFRQLKRNPRAAGLSEHFQLWDTLQQRHVFNSRRMWWNEDVDILDIIAGAKERLLDAESFAAEIDGNNEVLVNAVNFFSIYQQALESAGAIDFADMVPLVVRAMVQDAVYSQTVTSRYDHLLIDEYQDVNPGQVQLIDRFVQVDHRHCRPAADETGPRRQGSFFLAGRHLWVVGDDDQTLYAFRAADVRYTLEFSKKYCGARVHVLDRNYRSAARIVAAAKQLIANNRRRQAKDYQPFIGDLGEIVIRGYSSPEIEARQTARAVLKLLEQLSPRQIAILYRVGSVGLAVQPALQQLQIPYEVRGAGDLWQSVAAKLVVGSLYYLREGDSVEALSRMGNSRRADIIRRKLDLAEKDQKHSFAALCRLVRNAVVTALPSKASDRDRAEWRTVVETVVTVALSCASLEELEKRISEHSAALRNPPENAVALSTIHSAKGQEWEAVIMVGMEDGVLPHANNDDIEEERRVAYVGITRAKRILGLTYANVRYGQAASPSPFLHEIASKKRSACVWTGPRADTADERLPLLSERERHRVNENLQCIAIDSAGSSADAERTALSVASQDQSKGKKADGLPSRHGRSWSAQEDDRLRTMFLRGDGLAMIASAHQRKRGAIRSRLLKLGLIAENASPHSD